MTGYTFILLEEDEAGDAVFVPHRRCPKFAQRAWLYTPREEVYWAYYRMVPEAVLDESGQPVYEDGKIKIGWSYPRQTPEAFKKTANWEQWCATGEAHTLIQVEKNGQPVLQLHKITAEPICVMRNVSPTRYWQLVESLPTGDALTLTRTHANIDREEVVAWEWLCSGWDEVARNYAAHFSHP